jgi:glycerophosphoryl diester phosphodiesterase
MFNDFTVIGHRGAAGLEAENTIESVRAAIKCGVSWIEFDVQRVEDSLVVIHDDRLERTTDGSGWTLQHSLSELRLLRVGGNGRIPLLEEILSECRGKVGVNIEIKSPDCAELVGTLLHSYQWPADSVLVSSFLHSELDRFRALFGLHYHVAPIIKGELGNIGAVCGDLRPVCLVNEYSCLTKNFIRNVKALGLGVLAYTVNYPDKMRELLANGVDGVFSDFPDRLLAASPEYARAGA